MSRNFRLFLSFIIALSVLRPLAPNAYGPYLFLLWNIFLAALPWFLALFVKRMRFRPFWRYLGTGAWLLFFPNAPYIVTDLVHLNHSEGFDWYDTVLILAAGLAGLKFTYDSLSIIVDELKFSWPRVPEYFWNSLFLGLAAFGIYLGRYLRFNSWDILHAPQSLAYSMYHLMRHPFQHQEEWFMIAIYGLFLLALRQIWPRETSAPERLKP